MTSTTYQRILAEGEARGEARGSARLLANQLELRLGERARSLLARLEACADATVVIRAGGLVATLRQDEELAAALEALLGRDSESPSQAKPPEGRP